MVIGSPTGLYGFAFGEHAYSASKGGCHALARVGQPSEVAGLIAWLTSPDASYATGGYYPVDGGQMCL